MSQTGINIDWTQEIGETPINMAYKRQRRGSYNKKRYGKPASAVVRVPRAISTRGTPNGYYEIPMRQLFRVYCNTSTGFWNTNQTTSAAIGATGYPGMGIYATLDNTYITLGNNGISATIAQSVTDFASAQNLFDLCKISDMSIQCWFTNHSRELGSGVGAFGAMEAFFVEDVNDAVPPGNLGRVLDKPKVVRVAPIEGRMFNLKCKPHIVLDAQSESATSTAVAQTATYVRCDTPAVSHFGFKACAALPTDATSYVAILNILVTQTRRYKMNQ